jgi:flagella basal body P-ring formation protein FlgA
MRQQSQRVIMRNVLRQSGFVCLVKGRHRPGIGLAAMMAVVLALTGSLALAEGTIHLRRATQTSEKITLGDVARLQGAAAQKLDDLVLGQFDQGQTQKTISLGRVRDLLTDRQVNWGRLSLTGFMACKVTRQKQTSAPDANQASDALRDASNGGSGKARAEDRSTGRGEAGTLRRRVYGIVQQLADIKTDRLRVGFSQDDAQRLSRPIRGARYELAPQTDQPFGRLPITIRRFEQGRVAEQFTVSAHVQRRVQALVATRTISRGSALRESNVKQTTVWLDDDRTPIDRFSAVKERRADAVLRADQVVYPDDVQSPTLVERGQVITVRCFTGGLVVRTVARAMDDGAKDETIKVRNEASREKFTCRVTGPRQAVVDLRDQPNAAKAMAKGRGSAQ